MTQSQKVQYQSVEELRAIINKLKGKKYRLDCGHHLTVGHHLGNNIIVYNGKEPKIICSLCGY